MQKRPTDQKEYEHFYEEITIKAVTDTVTMLLKYPFGFHGDTGIRDYLYARLHVHGDETLNVDGPSPKDSILLLQSEHYTRNKHKNPNKADEKGRFDLALTLPPKPEAGTEDGYAENLDALFAFELGKNKRPKGVIDPEMVNHATTTNPGRSDITKLWLELKDHKLMQGWAIEFYNNGETGAIKARNTFIRKTLGNCTNLDLKEGKKLVIIFVEFFGRGKRRVRSNHPDIQSLLKKELPPIGIKELFRDRANLANRIITIGCMENRGRTAQYVNLSFEGKKNIAQIHSQENSIALVLRSIKKDRPLTCFAEIPVTSLTGRGGSNAAWLDGVGQTFKDKGPAIAFLVPDNIVELDDNSKEWQDVVKLLDHAKTLA